MTTDAAETALVAETFDSRPGAVVKKSRKAPRTGHRSAGDRPSGAATAILLVGALYCLLPVLWVVVASTKSGSELFSTFTFAPSSHFLDNVSDLNAYRGGLFWRWMANTALYAGIGGLLSGGVIAGLSFVLFDRMLAVVLPLGVLGGIL